MKEKIKVLHVTEKLQAGGIENFIMNVYRNIDRDKIDFNFLVTRDENEFFEEEIQKLGGKKFVINSDKKVNVFIRVLKESKELKKFLKDNKYDVVHIHSGTPLRIFYLRAAKKAGVPKRIYHSHSAEVKGPHSGLKVKKIIFRVLKNFFELYGTHFLACSRLAGEWMYTPNMIKKGKVQVINNGININNFKYDEEIRKKHRDELNILDNEKLIGHIGRFNDQKNHTYLIDIFNEIYKKNKNYKLCLLGDGELKEKITEKVNKLNLTDAVCFLGVRDDVNYVMQAMDLFLLPSNYEGLPVVGIEAQAAGLPMVCSDNITNEVCITNNVKMISLNETPKYWAEKIISICENFKRNDTSKEIKKYGYDVYQVANIIKELYIG